MNAVQPAHLLFHGNTAFLYGLNYCMVFCWLSCKVLFFVNMVILGEGRGSKKKNFKKNFDA